MSRTTPRPGELGHLVFGIPVALLLRQPELALKLMATKTDSFTPWETT